MGLEEHQNTGSQDHQEMTNGGDSALSSPPPTDTSKLQLFIQQILLMIKDPKTSRKHLLHHQGIDKEPQQDGHEGKETQYSQDPYP